MPNLISLADFFKVIFLTLFHLFLLPKNTYKYSLQYIHIPKIKYSILHSKNRPNALMVARWCFLFCFLIYFLQLRQFPNINIYIKTNPKLIAYTNSFSRHCSLPSRPTPLFSLTNSLTKIYSSSFTK